MQLWEHRYVPTPLTPTQWISSSTISAPQNGEELFKWNQLISLCLSIPCTINMQLLYLVYNDETHDLLNIEIGTNTGVDVLPSSTHLSRTGYRKHQLSALYK